METFRQLAAIAEGKLDVAFIRPRPNYPEGVVVEVLLTEKLLLAMPVGHPQSAAPEVRALADETFVVPNSGGFAEHAAHFVAAAGIRPGLARVVQQHRLGRAEVEDGSRQGGLRQQRCQEQPRRHAPPPYAAERTHSTLSLNC